MKSILVSLILCASCLAQVPDAPSHSLTWKKTFNWELFTVSGAELTSSLLDIHYTLVGEQKGCALESTEITGVGYHASRSDLLKKNLPFDAGVIGVAIVLRKVGAKVWWMTAPAVAIVKHSQGIYDWHKVCSY